MQTQCKTEKVKLQGPGKREVIADFAGGDITSDAGVVLLREVEKRTGIIERFSKCFKDQRDQRYVEHPLRDLLAQRIYALCLGYEDLNDHEDLRSDPCPAVAVGKEAVVSSDNKTLLAGKSTLNRLELVPESAEEIDRYRKITYDAEAIEQFFLDVFIDGYEESPEKIILDLDPTDDPLHGNQEGGFFHGYYGCYCYPPLYAFCEDRILLAKTQALRHRCIRRCTTVAAQGSERYSPEVAGSNDNIKERQRFLPRAYNELVRRQ